MHFFRRIAASLENIQQRNIVNKRRFLEKCLFGMQKRGIVHQIRALMSLFVLVVVISAFTDGAEPISASGAGLIDGNPHMIRIATPVVDGFVRVTIPGTRKDSYAVRAEPAGVTTLANVIVFTMERIRITLVANPIVRTAGHLPRSALRATEIKASSVGTFCVRLIQLLMCGTEPFMSTNNVAAFDRVGYIAIGTNPSFAARAERLCFRTINGGAPATPGLVGRTHCVRTIRDLTRRTFPTVHARRIRIIDTSVTARLAAPTIPVRTGVGLQMPNFATEIFFINITIPGVIAGCSFRRIIGTPTVFVFAIPITVRTRCRK